MIVIAGILQEEECKTTRLGKNREKILQMEPRFEDEFDQMKRKKKYLFRGSDIWHQEKFNDLCRILHS